MSAYKRTTRDEYDVEGCYAGGWEPVTAEDTYREARARLREYRENEPGTAFRIVKHRIPLVMTRDEAIAYCEARYEAQALLYPRLREIPKEQYVRVNLNATLALTAPRDEPVTA